MGRYVNPSGLVVAGIGFFLTRFTVTLAVYQDPVRFYVAGVIPLALGLGLSAFGVALAVADVEETVARTTAVWCVIGAATMLVLVVLTVLGSVPEGSSYLMTLRSRTYLSNFLIGGSVGGTLTGLYAARNRRHRRELEQQAQRLEVLNRMLRHEVLNAVTVIRGYAADDRGPSADPEVVDEYASDIEDTIDEVKDLTWHGDATTEPVDVGASIDRCLDTVADRFPDATVTVDARVDDPTVYADRRLDTVLYNLVENAIVHDDGDAPTVEVTVADGPRSVRISVNDEGPGLPERRRALLESGEIEEYDDPGTGFGLDIVRFLVESYGGSVETDVDADGTTVTVALPRADVATTSLPSGAAGVTGVRPAVPHLSVIFGAALVAGVLYGVAAELMGNSVAFIGLYYGRPDVVVGWITHEFHSVVFGFMFAGIVSLAPRRYRDHAPAYAAIGTGWGIVLWFVAAGFVSPIWLRLLGEPAGIPTLSPTLLVTHLVWGVSLGLLTALGYAQVAPRLGGLLDRASGGRGTRG